MARNSESLNTLISTSGTIAGMGLAIVGILAAKQSMQYSEMISDDMFLFRPSAFCWWWLSAIWRKNIANSITTPAWCGCGMAVSLSLLLVVAAALVLLYAEA